MLTACHDDRGQEIPSCRLPSDHDSSASQAGPPALFQTSFASSEVPLSEGGKWTNGKAVGIDWNDVRSASGRAHASVRSGITGRRYDDSIAHVNPSFLAFPSRQFAEGTVYRLAGYAPAGSHHEIELLLHFQITPHTARGYEVLWGWDGPLGIVRWNGPIGKYTTLCVADLGRLQDGDVVRAQIVDGLIDVYKNGRLVATGPRDTTWIGGQPGVGFWPVESSDAEAYGWKSYRAGEL
jgi:hypothetical protein